MLAALGEIVGRANVLTGTEAERYLIDWRGAFRSDAIAVVRPATVDQVADVIVRCRDEEVAIVPQGGNTGLSGGATTALGRASIILSVERLRQIEEVVPDRWALTAQAGATIDAVQEVARAAGRLFAPDWGARGTATIGGAVATDAGGVNVLRYGNMRDNVLGLEAVTADGRIWNGLRALRKDSSGYDLKQLFVGSEGTLGVITRAVVKLHPATPHARSGFASLAGLDHLPALLDLARATASDTLTAFELIPAVGVRRVQQVYGIQPPLEDVAEFSVLIKLADQRPVDDTLASLFGEALHRSLITDAVMAGTLEQEQRLWTIRDELPAYRIFEHHLHALKMDTAVPIDRIGDYHRAVLEIVDQLVPDSLAYGFGHCGDGNIHMTILPTSDTQLSAFTAAKPELMRRIDALTFDLGGTLSAEHGIGQELLGRIASQKSDVEWDLMREVKRAFDPGGLMNPGVLFP